MARLTRTLMFLALIFMARPAFAGGACPSGANYTNPSNPTGPLVTLSSLGITSCYFVAASGVDTNAGTTEASPWLHAPGMSTATGIPASVWSGTLPAGTGIIFRGGDTWHFGNSSSSPYSGGSWNLNISPYPVGTSSNPIYIGVDSTWFSGSSWARPIFTGDNSLCNAATVGTLPDGATCTSASSSTYYSGGQTYFNQSGYYVSSCPYQIGSANIMVNITSGAYFVLDNLEMSGLCNNLVGQPFGDDTFIRYGSANGPLTFQNLYVHGTSHVQFAGLNSGADCNGSNVCININVFNGSVPGAASGASLGENILLNVFDFSDSDPGGQQLGYGGFYNVAYNVVRYYTNFIPGTLHSYHDNLSEYFLEDGHSNLIESYEGINPSVIYNNVFRHIENNVTSGGGVFLWLGPQSGVTDYIFDNVAYDVGNLEYLNMGGTGLTTNPGNYTFFNNTWQTNSSQAIFRCNSPLIGTTLDTNNHYIDDGGQYLSGSGQSSTNTCTGSTSRTVLAMTNATATADGYTPSQTYAYSPTSSSSPTVGQGTNETSGYVATLLASSDPLIHAAGLAAESDTGYACTYNSAAHTISCPARTAVAHPANWAVGAYESSGLQSSVPSPPSNLTAVVQ